MKHAQNLLIKTNAFKPYILGQKVWLEATNLRTTHPTAKLRPKRYGPFTITRVISHVAYQLDLPPQWKIHNVFHAVYLSPYKETEEHRPNFPEPPPDLIEGEKEYEVEHIVGMRRFGRNKKLQYKVRWKGYSEAHDSWEPVDNIHAPKLLEEYHRETRTVIRATRINTTPQFDETTELTSPLLPHSQPPQQLFPSQTMSSSRFMPEFTHITDAIPRHRLYYLEERDLELLGIKGMGCPPDPKKVDEYITDELGLDIDSPMFKWDVDSLIEDYIQQLPDDHPYIRTNESPEPLPVPLRLPSIAQLELGEELAEDIPRLPSPPFAEFPTVSALASEESDTPSTPPSWSPISDDPPMCNMEHPGSPWERYDFRTHPTYIMIPTGPEGDQIFHQAPFIQFRMHHITGEPEIMGTNGSGCSVHSEPLFAAPNPGPAIVDDTKFTHLEEPQVTGNIDEALIRLNDPGVRAEVIRLRQEAERRRALIVTGLG
jgi:hypothetical protein